MKWGTLGGNQDIWSSTSPQGPAWSCGRGWDCHHILNVSRKHPHFLRMGKSAVREYGYLGGLRWFFFPDYNFFLVRTLSPWCSKTPRWLQMLMDTDLKTILVLFDTVQQSCGEVHHPIRSLYKSNYKENRRFSHYFREKSLNILGVHLS